MDELGLNYVNELKLNYWIRSEDPGGVDQVKILETQTVFHLREAIKSANSATFRDVDLRAIRLYKPTTPVSRPYEDSLSELTLSDHAEFLEGEHKLSEIFPVQPPKGIHVIVDAPSIKCWFRHTTLDASFEVSIRAGPTTSQVKQYIKKTQPSLANVAEQDIRLYRIWGGEDELRESLAETGKGEPLERNVLMANFVGVPVLDPLYIVVEDVGVVSRGEKRKREEDVAAEMDYLNGAQLANCAPPTLAQPEEFLRWRKTLKGAEIADGRRFCVEGRECIPNDVANDLPHISLQYEGFGHFIDIFHGARHVPGMEKVKPSTLGLAVGAFAEKMALIYAEEGVKREEGLAALHEVFAARFDDLDFSLEADSVSKNAFTDGCRMGPHRIATCIADIQDEIASEVIPYVEMTSHFAHPTRDSKELGLLGRWNYPCLGITVVAQNVTFYGMMYNGPEYGWRVDALTPKLSCTRSEDRNALHNAFVAASVLLARISQDARQLLKDPSPSIHGCRVLPPISSLCCPGSQPPIRFKISGFLLPRAPDRPLYMATTTAEDGEEKNIVVKFTQSYSYELHKFCADRGQAPKLLGFQRLPGGFFGIAMEYVESVARSEIQSGWEKQLEDLVKAFHAEGLVHGDLRKPNIIFSEGNKVMVIDFDWAGKEGEVYYPSGSVLNDQLLEDRASCDLKITKDDDLRVMCKALKPTRCGYCTHDSL